MTASEGAEQPGGFRGRAILALVLVSLLAFCAFAVLGAYAPSLRGRMNPGTHALSGSAVGFRGATILLRGLGREVAINRGRFNPEHLKTVVLVQTPGPATGASALRDHPEALRTLIVLPKWQVQVNPLQPGTVSKAGVLGAGDWPSATLRDFSAKTQVVQDGGRGRTTLLGAGGMFKKGTALPTGPIDQLQTASGPGWTPVLTDAAGRGVLLHCQEKPYIYLLTEPDLLNNQGLASLDNARVGMTILGALQGEGGALFDVTLNGLKVQPSLARLMLEPPWLAATLCLLAAAVLMGARALARFGAPMRQGRQIALGGAALVDNSAGLIRLARKEPEMAPDYLLGLIAEIGRDVGANPTLDPAWLERLARRRGLSEPAELADEAARARTRDHLMAFAARAHGWRREMTGDV